MIFLYIIMVLAIIDFIINWYDNKPKVKSASQQYKEGYDAAVKSIDEKWSAQILYDQCQGDDPWDRGWMQACVDHGAIKKQDYENI